MNTITVQTSIKVSLSKVWEYWNKPEHITRWAFAQDDWEAFGVRNDLRVGGKFLTTMSAKDKSSSFDFTGTYTEVKENELIEYDMDPELSLAMGQKPVKRKRGQVFN